MLLMAAPQSYALLSIESPANNTSYSHPEIWIKWSSDFAPDNYNYTLDGAEYNFSLLYGGQEPETIEYAVSGSGAVTGIALGNGSLWYAIYEPENESYTIYRAGTDDISSSSGSIAADWNLTVNITLNESENITVFDLTGISFALDSLWVLGTNGSSSVMYNLNLTNATYGNYCDYSCVIQEANITDAYGNATEVSFDGEYFWLAYPEEVVKADASGSVISSFSVTGINISGIAFDGEHLWAQGAHGVYRINPPEGINGTCDETNGCILNYFSTSTGSGLAYDSTGGSLWSYVGGTTSLSMRRPHNMTVQLSDGSHTLAIFATDNYGTVSNSTATFTIDTSVPEITIIYPENRTYTTENFIINFTANDALSGLDSCSISIDSGNYSALVSTNNTGGFEYNATGLEEGTHNISVLCNDTLGNSGVPETRIFAVDKTAPGSVVFNAPSANETKRDKVSVNVSASDNYDVASVKINVSSQAGSILVTLNKTGSYFTGVYDSGSQSLEDGVQKITAIAEDSAGNVNAGTSIEIFADNEAPDIYLEADSISVKQGDKVDFTITVNRSDIDNSTIKLWMTKGSTRIDIDVEESDTEQGIYTATIYTDGIAGVYTAHASVKDMAGNKREDTWSIEITTQQTSPPGDTPSTPSPGFVFTQNTAQDDVPENTETDTTEDTIDATEDEPEDDAESEDSLALIADLKNNDTGTGGITGQVIAALSSGISTYAMPVFLMFSLVFSANYAMRRPNRNYRDREGQLRMRHLGSIKSIIDKERQH